VSERPIEYEASPFENVVLALARLQLNAGLIDAIAFNFPEEVQRNWEEKLELLCQKCYAEIEEIQSFAEAYDH